jgi:hypothetical protein
MNELRRKCPLCGGELIRSRSSPFQFWRLPWARRLFDWGDEKVFPWACMGCGVVLLYLERLPVLTEEAENSRIRAVAPKAQPAHLKS